MRTCAFTPKLASSLVQQIVDNHCIDDSEKGW